MPPKGHRGLGEDTKNTSIRLPGSIIAQIDAYVKLLRKEHPYMPVGRAHAVSELVRIALEARAAKVTDTPVTDTVTDTHRQPDEVEPAATSAGGAIPTAPAYEARTLTPDPNDREDLPRRRRIISPLDQDVEDMPLTMEPTAVTQESVVPTAETVKTARPKAAATPKPARTTKGRK